MSSAGQGLSGLRPTAHAFVPGAARATPQAHGASGNGAAEVEGHTCHEPPHPLPPAETKEGRQTCWEGGLGPGWAAHCGKDAGFGGGGAVGGCSESGLLWGTGESEAEGLMGAPGQGLQHGGWLGCQGGEQGQQRGWLGSWGSEEGQHEGWLGSWGSEWGGSAAVGWLGSWGSEEGGSAEVGCPGDGVNAWECAGQAQEQWWWRWGSEGGSGQGAEYGQGWAASCPGAADADGEGDGPCSSSMIGSREVRSGGTGRGRAGDAWMRGRGRMGGRGKGLLVEGVAEACEQLQPEQAAELLGILFPGACAVACVLLPTPHCCAAAGPAHVGQWWGMLRSCRQAMLGWCLAASTCFCC